MRSRCRHGALALILLAVLAPAGGALAHVERTSYWPDPRPDASVTPAAGGEVPAARTLASALDASALGTARVVCQPDSMDRLRASVAKAETDGYDIRPHDHRSLSTADGDSLIALNQQLFDQCSFSEIQPAVTASGNNDRVVIMPGVYTEPSSRAVPDFPPECEQYRTDNSDHGSGAVSYEYQYHCPNAQSLVAVIGRAPDTGPLPTSDQFSRPDPHGIPNAGACIRCNMQIEGSGVSADDVVLDAGDVSSGNGAPLGSKKDVTLKVDRADGFVALNMTLRHAAEHDAYVLETDGYLMDRMKYFYAGEYGTLTFTSDHGLTENCDSAGHGDSAVYPGGAPDTGAQTDGVFYPKPRLNQEIRDCDLHHSNLGYSGTMGNATWVHDNNFWGNTTGIATDSFYAGGHPGYPQDSAVFEDNRIWSNNFNIYADDSDITSATPVPIGVGILIGGGNYNAVRQNHIWDNWRDGTMLIGVPDAVSCAPDGAAPPKCLPKNYDSTSHHNKYYGNVMSRTPDGQPSPNGVDFWWDEMANNSGNCWFGNVGSDGTAASVTSDPPPPPMAGTSIPKFLPEDCDAPTNVGAGDANKQQMEVRCLAAIGAGNWDPSLCDWFQMPAKPGSAAAKAAKKLSLSGETATLTPFCRLAGGLGGTLSCRPFLHRV